MTLMEQPSSPSLSPKSGIKSKTIDELAPVRDPKPKKISPVSARERARLIGEAEEWKNAGDWEKYRPGHFVALYAACHERVYGFYPVELETGQGFGLARMMASRLLKTTFKGNCEMMVDFLRWTWVREEGREKWRRENNQGGQRIGWKLQFGVFLVSDYRVDRTRKA